MKLTDREIDEQMSLSALQKSHGVPMMQSQYDRLKYLNKKELHNNCSNPHCIGYEGTEEQTVCPYCKHKLFKLI